MDKNGKEIMKLLAVILSCWLAVGCNRCPYGLGVQSHLTNDLDEVLLDVGRGPGQLGLIAAGTQSSMWPNTGRMPKTAVVSWVIGSAISNQPVQVPNVELPCGGTYWLVFNPDQPVRMIFISDSEYKRGDKP
jgi:hypothetical protein